MNQKSFKTFVLSGLLFVGALCITQSAFSAITGSAHDFQSASWNTSQQICIVCHTPHNASTTVTDAPLWNHTLSAVSNYTLYSSATLNAHPGQPDGSSKLCLSCHDGTVALDSFGGAAGNVVNKMTGDAALGTDLSNDHPISFDYDGTLLAADPGLVDPVSDSGLGHSIAVDMLRSGKVQCSSCHDVHNSKNLDHLLVKSNAGSALCLTCHNK